MTSRIFLAAILLTWVSAAQAGIPCTSGQNCYRDCVENLDGTGNDVPTSCTPDNATCFANASCSSKNVPIDDAYIHVEDFDNPALADFSNATDGWADTSAADDNPPGTFRGSRSWWTDNYGWGNTICTWNEGEPASPVSGPTCVSSNGTNGCAMTEWSTQHTDKGVNGCVDIFDGVTQKFNDELAAQDPDNSIQPAGNGALALRVGVQEIMGFVQNESRDPNGGTWGVIDNRAHWLTPATDVGLTMLFANADNVIASGVLNEQWKHMEFHDDNPNFAEAPFVYGGTGGPFPLGGFIWCLNFDCSTNWPAPTCTIGSANNGGTNINFTHGNFTQATDWPHGQVRVFRAHLSGLGTASTRLEKWVGFPDGSPDKKVLDCSWDGTKAHVQQYQVGRWNAYANANQTLDPQNCTAGVNCTCTERGTCTTEVTRRFIDNWHIRAGVPVSSAQALTDFAPSVERFGYWETSVTNTETYTNKWDYAEIQLNVEVVTPTSNPAVDYTWLGFHDGDGAGGQTGNVWKIRVMPLETGSHTVRWWWTGTGTLPGTCTAAAKCSDTFVSTDSGKYRGPLVTSGHHFNDSRGSFFPVRPYYLEQFHFADNAVLWDTNGLDLMNTYGFNVLTSTFWQDQNFLASFAGTRWAGMECIGGTQDGITTNSRTTHQACATGGGKAGFQPGSVLFGANNHYPLYCGTPPQFSCPGETYDWDIAAMAEAEARLNAASEQSIAWSDFDGIFSNITDQPKNYTENGETNRIKNFLARWSPLCAEGCIWNVAQECDEIEATTGDGWCEEQAAEIKATDPYDHPVGIHAAQGGVGSITFFADDPSIDTTVVQADAGQLSDAKQIYDVMAGGAYTGRNKPVYCTECSWYGPEAAKVTEDGLRTGMWGVVVGGGSFLFADQFDFEPAIDYTPDPDTYGGFFDQANALAYAGYLHGFVDSLDWGAGVPSTAHITGGTDVIGYSKANTYYLAYDQAGSDTFTITPGTGTYDVSWFNPRTGATTPASPAAISAPQAYTKPDTNDWVLLAAIQGAPTPSITITASTPTPSSGPNGTAASIQVDWTEGGGADADTCELDCANDTTFEISETCAAGTSHTFATQCTYNDPPGVKTGAVRVSDAGSPTDTDTYTFTVTSGATCGDGTQDPGEACDDGNTVGADRCSATCDARHIKKFGGGAP